MPSACDPGTLGCKYSASDSNSGPHDGSSHCSQQCSVQSVSDGKIRSCGSCFRIPVLSLYQLSPETREMANTFLIILSVVMLGMSYQMPTNGGIIRGSGSIAYSMKVDLISTWAIVIPLSMFMAFVVKASPAIVVCCLNADQIFKCVPAFLKCHYGHWIKTMTNISWRLSSL